MITWTRRSVSRVAIALALAAMSLFLGSITSNASVAGGPKFLISPTSFHFADVPLGSQSSQQAVTITNVSGTSQVMSGAGGGAGVFGGAQDCQGQTLAPGSSCHMYYQSRPPRRAE